MRHAAAAADANAVRTPTGSVESASRAQVLSHGGDADGRHHLGLFVLDRHGQCGGAGHHALRCERVAMAASRLDALPNLGHRQAQSLQARTVGLQQQLSGRLVLTRQQDHPRDTGSQRPPHADLDGQHLDGVMP